jgi:hypothetical protein
MSERGHDTESPDVPEEDDERLREAQEGTGYGEDEGEREAGLEREAGGGRGDGESPEPGAD